MAFTIAFYTISDPPNKLDKSIPTATKTATCTPFEPVSDLTGSVLIDYVAGVEGCNYAQITGDGRPRYCFITDIQKDVGGHMRVYLREDPLMTFKTEIQDSAILATRSSVVAKDNGNVGYNAYLQDGYWVCDATELHYTSRDLFDGYFNYDTPQAGFILLTAG